jgi:hypothetical protein
MTEFILPFSAHDRIYSAFFLKMRIWMCLAATFSCHCPNMMPSCWTRNRHRPWVPPEGIDRVGGGTLICKTVRRLPCGSTMTKTETTRMDPQETGQRHQGRTPRILFHCTNVLYIPSNIIATPWTSFATGARSTLSECEWRGTCVELVPHVGLCQGVLSQGPLDVLCRIARGGRWWGANRFFTCRPPNPVNPNKCNRTSKCYSRRSINGFVCPNQYPIMRMNRRRILMPLAQTLFLSPRQH